MFALEAILKIIAFGFFYCGTASYFRNTWNALDFFIALISVRFFIFIKIGNLFNDRNKKSQLNKSH
jgi:hypothetical protein